MEIFSIITNEQDILTKFDEFIYIYPKIKFSSKDEDTAYFTNFNDGRNEIYYHFKVENLEEIRFNYSESDITFLEKEFGSDFYIIDLQYRNEDIIKELLYDFNTYLSTNYHNYSDKKIIYNHPIKGFVKKL
ncbi:hypothetical protein CMU59_18125 [Elizabethkingia anophelis]|uniref:hypothetical protein n=1 Tax=Elizabethkingia anophelis TaxID=1117645 RepID=UPI00200F340A|nr:hypothetical protein [Elizabethkingia anophelis]MCL1035523.1 hypothetical protein [Elizabethkingia anophelis]MCW2462587.1 hypothetical protein [Elizabethkingia anophelis]MCW2466272.1 hypothetical protein [Elizabethkingia anophelis]MCW2469956.1 hypothetical protein [Elizabethkingia anophelis]MDV3574723.1 hypothetical protein [Elizabethkingia anophelis]